MEKRKSLNQNQRKNLLGCEILKQFSEKKRGIATDGKGRVQKIKGGSWAGGGNDFEGVQFNLGKGGLPGELEKVGG